jgi:hypothetical protein
LWFFNFSGVSNAGATGCTSLPTNSFAARAATIQNFDYSSGNMQLLVPSSFAGVSSSQGVSSMVILSGSCLGGGAGGGGSGGGGGGVSILGPVVISFGSYVNITVGSGGLSVFGDGSNNKGGNGGNSFVYVNWHTISGGGGQGNLGGGSSGGVGGASGGSASGENAGCTANGSPGGSITISGVAYGAAGGGGGPHCGSGCCTQGGAAGTGGGPSGSNAGAGGKSMQADDVCGFAGCSVARAGFAGAGSNFGGGGGGCKVCNGGAGASGFIRLRVVTSWSCPQGTNLTGTNV